MSLGPEQVASPEEARHESRVKAGLARLVRLENGGLDESSEAEQVRDQIDVYWHSLSEQAQERCRKFSAELEEP